MQSLLIPADDSDPAAAAAEYGFALAAQLDATVHLLSVVDSSLVAGATYMGDSERTRERLHDRAQERVAALADTARDRGIDPTGAVRSGIPAEEIVDYAGEQDLDGIVMGTHGRGDAARMAVGSVTDKVIRTSPIPVVSVNQEVIGTGAEPTEVDSLLLPTDGSEPAEAAARRGLDLAQRLDATVHLLSVVDEEVASGLSTVVGDPDTADDLTERATEHLSALVTEAQRRGLEFVTVTTEGTPAAEIVAYATENGIDAIVMGTQGRSGFDRLVVGNVTDDVVRDATVPVVTIGPSEEEFGDNA